MRDEITYAVPNFNRAAVEVGELINNFILHSNGHVRIKVNPCYLQSPREALCVFFCGFYLHPQGMIAPVPMKQHWKYGYLFHIDSLCNAGITTRQTQQNDVHISWDVMSKHLVGHTPYNAGGCQLNVSWIFKFYGLFLYHQCLRVPSWLFLFMQYNHSVPLHVEMVPF